MLTLTVRSKDDQRPNLPGTRAFGIVSLVLGTCRQSDFAPHVVCLPQLQCREAENCAGFCKYILRTAGRLENQLARHRGLTVQAEASGDGSGPCGSVASQEAGLL